jgi:hypothetical protein
MTPSGIEAGTFRLVARCLNQLRYCVLRSVYEESKFRSLVMRSLDSEEKSGMNHPVMQGHVAVEEVTKAAVSCVTRCFLNVTFVK